MMKEKEKIKIALACSAGGHLMEMRQLAPFYMKHDYFFVTEATEVTKELARTDRVYFLKLTNRRMWGAAFLLLWNSIVSLICLIRERPSIVLCTGALSTVPICLLAKLTGARLVFIESFCRIQTPTLTGRIIYPVADLFLVQWENMLRTYPKGRYVGGVY